MDSITEFDLAALLSLFDDLKMQTDAVSSHVDNDLVEFMDGLLVSDVLLDSIEFISELHQDRFRSILDSLTDAIIALQVMANTIVETRGEDALNILAAARSLQAAMREATKRLGETVISFMKGARSLYYLSVEELEQLIEEGENE